MLICVITGIRMGMMLSVTIILLVAVVSWNLVLRRVSVLIPAVWDVWLR